MRLALPALEHRRANEADIQARPHCELQWLMVFFSQGVPEDKIGGENPGRTFPMIEMNSRRREGYWIG